MVEQMATNQQPIETLNTRLIGIFHVHVHVYVHAHVHVLYVIL